MTVSSFAVLVALATVILILPWTSASGKSIGFIDSLFIATSAICVTGLSPLDISTEFSLFGQVAVLLMMQIGGLGLMTFTTSLYVWLGQRMPITDRLTMEAALLPDSSVPIKRILVYVAAYTAIVEIIGIFALSLYWGLGNRFQSFGETVWMATFHSVSAFTNAGLSLFSNSLVGFNNDPFVLSVIAFQIILGGLGFLVVYEILESVRSRFRSRSSRFRLSIQSKLTVFTTTGLIVIGTLALIAIEYDGAFARLSAMETVLNAFFSAVAPRTAGFNSIPLTEFGGAATLLTLTLMFIGASPGSTGGGIKTTTFGLLVAYSFQRFRGKSQLNLWNRTIPQGSIDRATAVVVASAATVLIAGMLLMFTETRGMSANESRNLWMPILFETISAFGTVGLSLDFTAQLSAAGKLILTFVMFVGRVGAITLALAISLNAKPTKFSYAEENIMIG